MHFFYLDEAGCTGENLADPKQPIFVLGGVSVRDEGWNKTQDCFTKVISQYFEGAVPTRFELHACDLLSSAGAGAFEGYEFEQRKQLARNILSLLHDRKHGVHAFAIDKKKLSMETCEIDTHYNLKVPYMIAYDYMLTYINWFLKEKRGSTARGMLLFDEKEQFEGEVRKITHFRRYEDIARHRINRIVEFSHPVDSKKNPMIQLSDLVVYCIKKFFEIEAGYRDYYPDEAKRFYAECFNMIDSQIDRKTLVPRSARGMQTLNNYLNAVQAKAAMKWRQKYEIA